MDKQAAVQRVENASTVASIVEKWDPVVARTPDSFNTASLAEARGESRVSLTDQMFQAAPDAGSVSRTRVSSPESDFVYAQPAIAPPGVAYHRVKRAVDVLGAAFGLLILAPLLLCVAALVALDSGAPIFHRRRVLGLHVYDAAATPHTFDAFKFRTMIRNADALLLSDPELLSEYEKDFKLRNDPRVTRIGDRLRRTSIDEIPQLLNVLRGQMTLVGPRMITPPELSMYGEHAALLLSVKPGLTGLWQVSGRQNINYQERVRLDLEYIRDRSIRLDFEILGRTIGSVLARRGAF